MNVETPSRPLWLALQSTKKWDESQPFCYGAKKKHEITLDYLEEFLSGKRKMEEKNEDKKKAKEEDGNHKNIIDLNNNSDNYPPTYRDVPKFAFAMHVELSHSSNSPAQHADEDLVAMLERLRADGTLDKTIFILMSDHGARFDHVRMKVGLCRTVELFLPLSLLFLLLLAHPLQTDGTSD